LPAMSNGTTDIACANCGNRFQGEFCNKCGQKVIRRFTAIYLWQRIREDVIGVEGGLVYTFKELWVRPGKMISNYIRGATHQYYGPLKYLVLWTALYLISLEFITKTQRSLPVPSGETLNDYENYLAWFMQQKTNFYLLGVIPFFSIVGYFLFRNLKFNFTEIVIFYTYFCGQFAFCGIVANLLNLIPGSSKELEFLKVSDGMGTLIDMKMPTIIMSILYFFLFFRMHAQFFKERFWHSILKGVGVYSFGTLIYWSFIYMIFNAVKYLG
jgi:hypothetical protein